MITQFQVDQTLLRLKLRYNLNYPQIIAALLITANDVPNKVQSYLEDPEKVEQRFSDLRSIELASWVHDGKRLV